MHSRTSYKGQGEGRAGHGERVRESVGLALIDPDVQRAGFLFHSIRGEPGLGVAQRRSRAHVELQEQGYIYLRP